MNAVWDIRHIKMFYTYGKAVISIVLSKVFMIGVLLPSILKQCGSWENFRTNSSHCPLLMGK